MPAIKSPARVKKKLVKRLKNPSRTIEVVKRAKRIKTFGKAMSLIESPLKPSPKTGERLKAIRILEKLEQSGVNIGNYGRLLLDLSRHSGPRRNIVGIDEKLWATLETFSVNKETETRTALQEVPPEEKDAFRTLIAQNLEKIGKIVNG